MSPFRLIFAIKYIMTGFLISTIIFLCVVSFYFFYKTANLKRSLISSENIINQTNEQLLNHKSLNQDLKIRNEILSNDLISFKQNQQTITNDLKLLTAEKQNIVAENSVLKEKLLFQ